MPSIVLTTVPNEEVAKNLSKILLENRVAACVNIIPNVKSLYWWNRLIEFSNELLLLIKTTEEKYNELEALIKKNHPYEIPEIISLDIQKGLKEYLNWIEDETRSLP
ncbi:MAG: divalent-cation tolerance protein CutA [Candidatus Methanofastidiosum sp.]|nr:divalent-cation tolerance protein CutA [Methanofastidiosum sp.]